MARNLNASAPSIGRQILTLTDVLEFNKKFKDKMGNINNGSPRFNSEESKRIAASAGFPLSNNAVLSIDVNIYDLLRALSNSDNHSLVIGRNLIDGLGYAEYKSNDNSYTIIATCTFTKNQYTFKIAKMEGVKCTAIEKEKARLAMVGALIGLLHNDCKELVDGLKLFDYGSNDERWDDEIFCKSCATVLCILTNALYYKIKDSINADLTAIRADFFPKKMEKTFGSTSFKHVESLSEEQSGFYQGCFPMNEKRTFTKEELSLIPSCVSAKTTVFSKWFITTVRDIVESNLMPKRIRNVLLLGDAGNGKSYACKIMAWLLGLPYVTFCCNPDTDLFDLLGQILPDTEGMSVNDIFKALDLPTFEDIENNFKASYQKLFGVEPDEYASTSDCYDKVIKTIFEKSGKTDSGFVFVKSDLIKAIELGWAVEIQEFNVIKKASVMVGLNSILETTANASITLATGEKIKRHPECVVFLTGNENYDGCGKIQQSVLSRMNLVRRIGRPSVDELVERTLKNTGISTLCEACVREMATIVDSVAKYCTDKDITDGVSGPRELEDWVLKAYLLAKREGNDLSKEYAIKAMFSTILQKVSQTPEDVEDIITAEINKKYGIVDVEAARKEYEAGLI